MLCWPFLGVKIRFFLPLVGGLVPPKTICPSGNSFVRNKNYHTAEIQLVSFSSRIETPEVFIQFPKEYVILFFHSLLGGALLCVNDTDVKKSMCFKNIYYSDNAICTYSHTEEGSNLGQPYALTESL